MIEILPGLFYNNSQTYEAFDSTFLSSNEIKVIISDIYNDVKEASILRINLYGSMDVNGLLEAIDSALMLYRKCIPCIITFTNAQEHQWNICLIIARLLKCHDPQLITEIVFLNYGINVNEKTREKLLYLFKTKILH